MSKQYLTIPQVAKETNIPASTVRRYLDQHSHSLRTKKSGRGAWLLQEEDVPLIREIRSCYERKMSISEVEDFLLQSGQPLTITTDDEQEQVITPANAFMQLADEVKHIQKEVTSTREQLSAAHEEIAALKQQQDEDSEQQKESMEALTSEMKSISDGIGRLERERQKRTEKSIWSRLFGR
ncbi:MerR family transcriptional regulator [Lentibacillus cibarius]|uniref:MerR family transcriptional regulator n=1 Tax=Lentibacillus cibarius TaxID=2583219 RepID=A0A549Y8U5_9BACI|nr:MerR family transcriptional regulator [Lentibacillus cibarius]TRM08320.1 MerR family transcriptional regulator [Lentibacillus cibarius]TRM08329.1 MerR family transcriptional regulator [Lentibacillus cibarius]